MCGVVRELLDLFGPKRCMVGSNIPVEKLAGDFGSLYDLILTSLQQLSDEQRADVLAGTASRFYRIPHPEMRRWSAAAATPKPSPSTPLRERRFL